jgi:hypothetical protein
MALEVASRDALDELVRVNIESADSTPCHARRAQHPKHHGCVAATFTVLETVPADLRAGIFEKPQSFEAWIRFSNGRQRDDRLADAHGMAIKLLDVPGEKLIEGHENETAQDFLLVDNDVFFTGDLPEYFFMNRGFLARNQSFAQKCAFWFRLLLFHPMLLVRMSKFAGNKPRSPLGSTYHSAVPFTLGNRAVKYVARPRSRRPQTPLTSADGLADALVSGLANNAFAFDFGVDVQTDARSQPIENATVSWSAHGARREWLAHIEIHKQAVDPHSSLAENLAFSPWHARVEHRPLGAINAVRKPVYQRAAIHRHRLNDISPADTSEVPGTPGCMAVPAPDASSDR